MAPSGSQLTTWPAPKPTPGKSSVIPLSHSPLTKIIVHCTLWIQPIDVFTSSSWHTSMATQPPTLSEILLGVTPPPWTLAAFKAYLFENHCIETIQFTFDSRRYAAFYDQFVAEHPTSRESRERVCGSWELLMQTYVTPCAPREVNLSSRVRDRLLNIPCGPSPPPPPELEDAIRSIFELMNESLLVPFLQSVGPD